MEKCGRDGQATEHTVTRRMRFSRWLTKATNTHSQYEIFTAYPWQQWLIEPSSILCYTCIACLEVLATSVRDAILVYPVLLNKVLLCLLFPSTKCVLMMLYNSFYNVRRLSWLYCICVCVYVEYIYVCVCVFLYMQGVSRL